MVVKLKRERRVIAVGSCEIEKKCLYCRSTLWKRQRERERETWFVNGWRNKRIKSNMPQWDGTSVCVRVCVTLVIKENFVKARHGNVRCPLFVWD